MSASHVKLANGEGLRARAMSWHFQKKYSLFLDSHLLFHLVGTCTFPMRRCCSLLSSKFRPFVRCIRGAYRGVDNTANTRVLVMGSSFRICLRFRFGMTSEKRSGEDRNGNKWRGMKWTWNDWNEIRWDKSKCEMNVKITKNEKNQKSKIKKRKNGSFLLPHLLPSLAFSFYILQFPVPSFLSSSYSSSRT